MPQDPWLHFLSVVGATFWRGFPYDVVFFAASVWAFNRTSVEDKAVRIALGIVAVFMAILIAVNLAIGTIPAWFTLETY